MQTEFVIPSLTIALASAWDNEVLSDLDPGEGAATEMLDASSAAEATIPAVPDMTVHTSMNGAMTLVPWSLQTQAASSGTTSRAVIYMLFWKLLAGQLC